MARILLAGTLLVAISGPAFAQSVQSSVQGSVQGLDISPNIIQIGLTLLGLVVAARLAFDAFARRVVPVADVPTFPRYMTSRTQYRLGSFIFALIACGFFLVLVYLHRDVADLSAAVGGDVIPQGLLDAVKDQSASYLTIIAAMGAIYLYLLTKEAQWNVLLIMRDVIYRWISIPQLAGQIVAQIRFALHVPQSAIAAVIASSPGVAEQDFRKDTNTPDRLWAETCYMKWWLTQGHDAGEDATFFIEASFGFDKLLGEFEQTSRDLAASKSGQPGNFASLAALFDKIKDLHNRFSRLVACYLIYRNSSRDELCAEAAKFGLEIRHPAPQYPLGYWIVYVIVLISSVYLGVYASAIICDALRGQGFNIAQDSDRAVQWIMYSMSNYGLAIVAVLSLRWVSASSGVALHQSHLVTYCWTFFVALLVGPLGLTIAVHYFSLSDIAKLPLLQLYVAMLKWGWGPALVCVYISYYLDRQTYLDLPNIDHSTATIGWRLANCFAFATGTIVLLLPLLLALVAPPGNTWDSVKLRVVATGTTFCLTLALALAAQFALRQAAPAAGGVRSPPMPPPVPHHDNGIPALTA
jgi:hypothetical protein